MFLCTGSRVILCMSAWHTWLLACWCTLIPLPCLESQVFKIGQLWVIGLLSYWNKDVCSSSSQHCFNFYIVPWLYNHNIIIIIIYLYIYSTLKPASCIDTNALQTREWIVSLFFFGTAHLIKYTKTTINETFSSLIFFFFSILYRFYVLYFIEFPILIYLLIHIYSILLNIGNINMYYICK